MSDPRYKDGNWDCDTCKGGSGKAEVAVLMDLRDEAKARVRQNEIIIRELRGLRRDIKKLQLKAAA